MIPRMAPMRASDGFVEGIARGAGSGRNGASSRPALLSALRWLWRRGNRARRYAKLKGPGTPGLESEARTGPHARSRQAEDERPLTENRRARPEPCDQLPNREANVRPDETR